MRQLALVHQPPGHDGRHAVQPDDDHPRILAVLPPAPPVDQPPQQADGGGQQDQADQGERHEEDQERGEDGEARAGAHVGVCCSDGQEDGRQKAQRPSARATALPRLGRQGFAFHLHKVALY